MFAVCDGIWGFVDGRVLIFEVWVLEDVGGEEI